MRTIIPPILGLIDTDRAMAIPAAAALHCELMKAAGIPPSQTHGLRLPRWVPSVAKKLSTVVDKFEGVNQGVNRATSQVFLAAVAFRPCSKA